MDPTNMNIKENISDLGAEIAKRFNLKVTNCFVFFKLLILINFLL